MNYQINPSSLRNMFAMPASVADNHIKLASHSALKVLIYIMRNGFGDGEEEICKSLGISETELSEALLYWRQADILILNDSVETNTANTTETVIKPTAKIRNIRATRNQIAKRADESKEVRLVLQQAEIKFCRPLKETEKSTLVYILDDLGISAPVTLMLIEYAVAENRTTASFLESTAVDWVNRSVDSVSLAEKEMQKSDQRRGAWSIVRNALGIDDRRASAKESEACVRWIAEWGFDSKMIRLAYDQCIDNTGKISFPYIDKILKNWHSAGISKPEDAINSKKPEAATGSDAPSFDLSLF